LAVQQKEYQGIAAALVILNLFLDDFVTDNPVPFNLKRAGLKYYDRCYRRHNEESQNECNYRKLILHSLYSP
jgi:hypothetical protein